MKIYATSGWPERPIRVVRIEIGPFDSLRSTESDPIRWKATRDNREYFMHGDWASTPVAAMMQVKRKARRLRKEYMDKLDAIDKALDRDAKFIANERDGV